MRADDLLDAIGEIGGEKIQRAREPAKKRSAWLKWSAAAVLLIALGAFALLRGGGNRTPDSQNALAPYRIAAAVYPDNAPYPDEAKYEELGGLGESAFRKAYSAWSAQLRARRLLSVVYDGALDGFLAESIPRFLADTKGENKVYSPLNVYMALAMLAETADGESRVQILNLLGVDDIETLREQANAVWNAHYVDDGASASVLASSLWLDRDVAFVPETMDRLADTYYASSYRGEMDSEDFNRALQTWLNENTGGLLQEQTEGVELQAGMDLALATTVYFRAKWLHEFHADRNTTGVFHAPDGDVSAAFMHQDYERAYYWGERFSAVAQTLDIGESSGEMWFLLPDEGVTPEELLADPEAMAFLLSRPETRTEEGRPVWENQKRLIVHLSLPKFDALSETDLTDGLKALGVTDVFDPSAADFSPMVGAWDGAYLSKAEHAARVTVDEEGVVAAAYTVMIAPGDAPPPDEEVDFVLDRPFVFAIKTTDDLPLFVGVVNQP